MRCYVSLGSGNFIIPPNLISRHVVEIEEFYKRRRDAMHEAATRHLTGLCEWSLPQGGMFLWIKVGKVHLGNASVLKGGNNFLFVRNCNLLISQNYITKY